MACCSDGTQCSSCEARTESRKNVQPHYGETGEGTRGQSAPKKVSN